uniref:Uncharacterized protein n=1 Tax=Myotis lucifugus TaxID=59463 RepID=G1Q332_MYOLU
AGEQLLYDSPGNT